MSASSTTCNNQHDSCVQDYNSKEAIILFMQHSILLTLFSSATAFVIDPVFFLSFFLLFSVALFIWNGLKFSFLPSSQVWLIITFTSKLYFRWSSFRALHFCSNTLLRFSLWLCQISISAVSVVLVFINFEFGLSSSAWIGNLWVMAWSDTHVGLKFTTKSLVMCFWIQYYLSQIVLHSS